MDQLNPISPLSPFSVANQIRNSQAFQNVNFNDAPMEMLAIIILIGGAMWIVFKYFEEKWTP